MKGAAVLIVDDEEADRYLLTRLLKQTSLITRVFEEADGQAAIDFFLSYEEKRTAYPDDYPPLVVFLDVNMPRLNGHEFLSEFEAVRKRLDLQSVVVMMFSSSERDDDKERALGYDFVADYLIKGRFSSDELKEKLASYL